MSKNPLTMADLFRLSEKGKGYALYRLPHETECTFVYGPAVTHTRDEHVESGAMCSFVIAPFNHDLNPIVSIRPETVLTLSLTPDTTATRARIVEEEEEMAAYRKAFNQCMLKLDSGELKKVVLARRKTLILPDGEPDSLRLFARACKDNADCYVALWWTPQSGCWLTATPELMVERDGVDSGLWHTMALAGTLPYYGKVLETSEWSEKNREEHAYVVDHIVRTLSGVATKKTIRTDACHSVRFGNVQHLRTLISFQTGEDTPASAIVRAIHPTPAVCGEPREVAMETIEMAEDFWRRYYAGVSGPERIKGRTSLFVSLRCMQIDGNRAVLYAGGGLLPMSSRHEEWDETERKLQPMLSLFQIIGA